MRSSSARFTSSVFAYFSHGCLPRLLRSMQTPLLIITNIQYVYMWYNITPGLVFSLDSNQWGLSPPFCFGYVASSGMTAGSGSGFMSCCPSHLCSCSLLRCPCCLVSRESNVERSQAMRIPYPPCHYQTLCSSCTRCCSCSRYQLFSLFVTERRRA